ncbi:MAG: HlyD family efflux transporter periplasmic adaptor subunit [Clostridia bacterium]
MLQKNAMEGQRVPAGHVVASIVNRQYMDVFHEIQYLGNEILLLKKNSGETSGIFTRDLKKINDDIIVLVSDIAGGLVQGDLSGFGFALANIQRNARMRNDIMVGAPTSDAYIRELSQKVVQLEKILEGNMSEIATVRPGYASYHIDGLEGEFSFDAMHLLSPVEVGRIIKERSPQAIVAEEITEGKTFMKTVNDDSFYMAFVLDNKAAGMVLSAKGMVLEADDPAVRIPLGGAILGEKDEVSTVVFFKVESKQGELTGLRRIKGKIILSEYNGLIVPVSSLVQLRSYPYKEVQLAVIKDIWVSFLDVRVVFENGTNAIIESSDGRFSLYDKYILKPDSVEEGQSIR